jgi:hypothetical protein
MFEWLVGIPAFFLLLVGVLAIMGKGVLGGYARTITGIIPFGGYKLWSAVFIIAGLALGGIAGAGALYSNIAGSVSTASVVSGTTSASQVPGVLDTCYLSTISAVGVGSNITFQADTQNLAREVVNVKSDAGAGYSINGTLNCKLPPNTDLSVGRSVDCYVTSDSFRNQVNPQTDSNTYYILATSSTKSKVPGYPWAQTAYLNDNAVASTASDSERTSLTFVRDDQQQALGYYFTLPGTTAFLTLQNNTQNNVRVNCGGKDVYTFAINKLA